MGGVSRGGEVGLDGMPDVRSVLEEMLISGEWRLPLTWLFERVSWLLVESVVVFEVHSTAELEEGIMECFKCGIIRCGYEFQTLVEEGNLDGGNGVISEVNNIVIV